MVTTAQAERARLGVARVCAEAPDEASLLEGVAARVRPLLDWDAGVWMTTDPSTTLFTAAKVEQFHPTVCQPWFDNELVTPDVNKFAELARTAGTALLSRTVDPRTSPRWAELMRPAGYDAEIRSTFTDPTGCWGVVEVHRESGRPDFDASEVDLVASLGPVVAAGLRRIAAEAAAVDGSVADGPGLLFVDEDGLVTGGTEVGEAWLELLMPPRPMRTPTSLHALAALVRSTEDRPRRIRLRARDGRWVTLHASPMRGAAGTAVIVEPAPSHEVADLLALAHGLSAREREVVLAVARGASTTEIATRLCISPHTVRDHLKASFAKVGVSGRTELVGRLFHDHHAERLFAQPL